MPLKRSLGRVIREARDHRDLVFDRSAHFLAPFPGPSDLRGVTRARAKVRGGRNLEGNDQEHAEQAKSGGGGRWGRRPRRGPDRPAAASSPPRPPPPGEPEGALRPARPEGTAGGASRPGPTSPLARTDGGTPKGGSNLAGGHAGPGRGRHGRVAPGDPGKARPRRCWRSIARSPCSPADMAPRS